MKVIYKGEDGECYNTENEAILSDALHATSLYLEAYKKQEIVKKLCETFTFTLKKDTQDETLRLDEIYSTDQAESLDTTIRTT